MTSRLQIRRDTQSAWTSANPVLLSGEIAFETDTNLMKVGNGTSTYASLPYTKTLGRTGTSSALSSANPVLAAGEIAFETNTNYIKVGNGSTAYNSLSYLRSVSETNTQSGFASTVLLSGQVAAETGTNLIKVGNGSTAYSSLPYVDGDYFRLTANGSAVSTQADFFASGAYTMTSAARYEFEFNIAFSKTTASTVTFYVVPSTAPNTMAAMYNGSPVGGIGTSGTAQSAGIYNASSPYAMPATGSLTTGVNHMYKINGFIDSSGGTLKLQAACASGSLTPLAGSYWKIKRLPASNYGVFA